MDECERELRIAAGHTGHRPTEGQLQHYAEKIADARKSPSPPEGSEGLERPR